MPTNIRLKPIVTLTVLLLSAAVYGQQSKTFGVKSPDGKIELSLQAGHQLRWWVKQNGSQIISPSTMALILTNGQVLGADVKVTDAKSISVNTTFNTPVYKKQRVVDHYNQLTLTFKGGFGLILRTYNDGAAYRFFTTLPGDISIKNETAEFNFDQDYKAFIPFVRDLRDKDKYSSSFEALYDELKLSKIPKDTLAFLPLLVDLGNGKKAALLEADLQDYPGMYMHLNAQAERGLQAVYSPYVLHEKLAGYNKMNYLADQRADYIAVTTGTRDFPWRAVVISNSDKDLLNNDMVQKLSPPAQVKDISWIKPGKVAWDWWNDWNISKVDFKAGINTDTYKYYIDFASKNKVEYVVLDEGWSETTNMLNISPQINLEEILQYAKQKNVGIILWATWYAVNHALDEAFNKYAKMGVKGFKIDFIDRDDQKVVKSLYKIAAKAADYKLIVDYHGMYKPTGIQRAYPNVVNFEGVKGMENVKWTPADDVPHYDTSIPYIRMLAGPMDYTPGAMRNATKEGFRPSNSLPMSQGTRSHQLAMYIVFEAPLQMMADSPTAYMKEQESTDFIAEIPTTFDETVALDGKVGEYVAIARKKGDNWYAGGMTNWTAREITLDLSFLNSGSYNAELFKDGVNADRDATDYKKEIIKVDAGTRLKLNMASGGGFAIRFSPVK